MGDLQLEIQSIADFVEPEVPNIEFHLQHMPETYETNEISIELVQSKPATETAYHYRINRTFQLVYFGTSKLDCMTKMQIIERKLYDKQLIPLGQTGRYLRIASFSLSQSFKTETTGVFAIIGMLEAEIREARTQVIHEKINVVDTSTTVN